MSPVVIKLVSILLGVSVIIFCLLLIWELVNFWQRRREEKTKTKKESVDLTSDNEEEKFFEQKEDIVIQLPPKGSLIVDKESRSFLELTKGVENVGEIKKIDLPPKKD